MRSLFLVLVFLAHSVPTFGQYTPLDTSRNGSAAIDDQKTRLNMTLGTGVSFGGNSESSFLHLCFSFCFPSIG